MIGLQKDSLIAKRNPLPEGSGSGSQISSASALSYEHRHAGATVALEQQQPVRVGWYAVFMPLYLQQYPNTVGLRSRFSIVALSQMRTGSNWPEG
jgi:hypothetical protein